MKSPEPGTRFLVVAAAIAAAGTAFAAATAAGNSPDRANDPQLLVAEGDALVRTGRPGEAIGVYRHAVKSGAPANSIGLKIAVAQERRQSLLHECETESGAAAERACDSAWLPGAPDEVAVFKRRGLLLQNANQPEASLGAYLSAARLAPRDSDVARAVVALTAGAGHADRDTLRARGTALMTLRRPADAIPVLREFLRLSPDDAGAKAMLRNAQGAVASQRRTAASAAALQKPAPETAAPDAGAFSNEAPATQSN